MRRADWSRSPHHWLFLTAAARCTERGVRCLRSGTVDWTSRASGAADWSNDPRGLSTRNRARQERGSRSGHPDGKVVGVENAQIGWFNAKLGARRTHHCEGLYASPRLSCAPSPLPLVLRLPSFPSGLVGLRARRNNVTTSEIR